MTTKKTALIVDDSKLTQKQLAKILYESEIEVIGFADNGAEAVEKYIALANKPDLITLDITMPLMDGLTVLKKILQLDSATRIVMVSAIGKEDIIKTCMATGARSFIVKPFNTEKVKEVIHHAIYM